MGMQSYIFNIWNQPFAMGFPMALRYALNFSRGNSWCFSKFTTMISIFSIEQIFVLWLDFLQFGFS